MDMEHMHRVTKRLEQLEAENFKLKKRLAISNSESEMYQEFLAIRNSKFGFFTEACQAVCAAKRHLSRVVAINRSVEIQECQHNQNPNTYKCDHCGEYVEPSGDGFRVIGHEYLETGKDSD